MIYEELEDKELEERLLSRQNKIVYPETFVKFRPMGCFLPREYAQYYESIRNMEVREDDVWVMSLIKSGKWNLYYSSRMLDCSLTFFSY